jgi:hypothetical protein
MATTPRIPPRFVPTLTEVVQTDREAPQRDAPRPQPSAPKERVEAPAPPTHSFSRLTNKRDSAGAAAPPPLASPLGVMPITQQAQMVPARARVTTANPTPVRELLDDEFEELLVHRVMQRVDVSLDHRLRETIASVVQEQTRSMLPRLREEVESVVRDAVYEAVAQELAFKPNQ